MSTSLAPGDVVADKYRKGEPTSTQSPDANKGKISDLGQ